MENNGGGGFTQQTITNACNEIRNLLKAKNPEYNLLSLRKGGLQRMALRGLPYAAILEYSRHTTIDMLMRYLDWGKCALTTPRLASELGLLHL